MRKILLANGMYSIIDDDDFDLVSKYKWYYESTGYASTNKSRKISKEKNHTIRMHSLIMNTPKGMEVDHISRDGLDNRKCNLRVCTHTENLRNRKINSNNTTGYKGVSIHRNCKNKIWHASITHNGRHLSCGYYKTREEAAKAYNDKAQELFGNYARLNNL